MASRKRQTRAKCDEKEYKKKPNWRFYVLEISNTPFDWHFPFAKRGREREREC
jgi:hypothetical protein